MPCAVLQRFGQVRAGNAVGLLQVGEGAGDLENPVQGAQRQVQALAGLLQPGLVFRAQCTILVHLLQCEKGVGATLASELALARGGDLSGQLGAAGTRPAGCEAGALATDGQVQVDTVQQRAGELGPVALDLFRRAAATAAGIAEIAAGAGVHRRDQLEARREAHAAVGAGNDDFAAFQW